VNVTLANILDGRVKLDEPVQAPAPAKVRHCTGLLHMWNSTAFKPQVSFSPDAEARAATFEARKDAFYAAARASVFLCVTGLLTRI
jgi:hypothetical protein